MSDVETAAAREFRMPSLGADMDAATVVRWLVKPGDTVARGDLVAEVETDKGVFDVDVREGGAVGALLVPAGTKVAVGTPILRFGAVAVAAPTVATAPTAPIVRASPAARRLAEEQHCDLAGVVGSGPHGVITLDDVRRALGGAAPVVAPDVAPVVAPVVVPTVTPTGASADGMRAAIAAAVTRSKREIPHYYLAHDIDLQAAMVWLQQVNAERTVAERLLPATLLIKAIATALASHREFNGFYRDGRAAPSDAIHVGVVTALRGGGLLAPAIPDTNTMPLDALNTALLDVVHRARTGGVRASELTDATISVTSLGDRGVGTVYGVIYPPQVAIIGLGTITDRPWAVQGMLDVRPVVTITLAADHRVSDGHRGGLFLSTIRDLLQHPEAL
ncbi:MAG: dihydrolipoamide acetyltransferase family protein [Gemmatimonadota bacterium]|nr:dihydrolipoamide acetyltransferase family protein [Gemmatimonadota bacterium]